MKILLGWLGFRLYVKKILLLSSFIGSYFKKIGSVSEPAMKCYCKKYEIDLIKLEELFEHLDPAWVRLECEKFLKEYDYVIYIDADVLIKENSPNILDFINEDTDSWDIYGFNETHTPKQKFVDRIYKYAENIGYDTSLLNYDGSYYINSGCVVYNKGFLRYFEEPRLPEINTGNYKDQVALNFAIASGRIRYKELPPSFGASFTRDSYNDDRYFVHFMGEPRDERKATVIKMFVDGYPYEEIIATYKQPK